MKSTETPLKGLLVIEPDVFRDRRGYFSETFRKDKYVDLGVDGDFVQDNLSFSRRRVLRGLHFQKRRPQAKLVQVLLGEVFDVAVDIRPESPTFGRWHGEWLSGETMRQMYVPEGFAHGFCVTSETALFSYKCSRKYDPADEGGLSWSDPRVGIQWPFADPVLSKKDAALPLLSEFEDSISLLGVRRWRRAGKCPMNLVLIGSNGQLGRYLLEKCEKRRIACQFMDLPEIDIADFSQVERLLEQREADAVINAAAYTAVDGAETDARKCFAVNMDGPFHLARVCARGDVPLVHVSTDFVFDGGMERPYREDDSVRPLGVYGRSKAEGELAVANEHRKHVIVRTSWLYGAYGKNFVKTMLSAGSDRDELKVVDDQFGSPTSAADLAEAILAICRSLLEKGEKPWGTYHFCGKGVTTWFRFASAVFGKAKELGMERIPRVRPVTTGEYPAVAQRPRYSALDCSKIQRSFGIEAPPWGESLASVLEGLLSGAALSNLR